MSARLNAETFNVTNTNDSGPGSLRQAILDANAAASDDLISFDPAVFGSQQTIVLTTGELVAEGNGALTINGPGANLLTISGNDASRVFNISGVETPTAANVIINGLTVTGGNANTAGGIGVNVDTISFAVINPANVTINNVVVTNNKTNSGGGGGGFHCKRNGLITINDSLISNNDGNGGGAVFLDGNGSDCFLNINNSTLDGNDGGSGGGGAILAASGVIINNSTISNNTTGNNQSAIRFIGIENNTCVIKNTTFFGNRTTGSGSTISIQFSTMELDGVTIAFNYTNDPNGTGGVKSQNGGDTILARNTIIANNFNRNGPSDLDAPGTVFQSQGYNIIENPGASVINGITTGNLIGVDPWLDGILRNNGGPTRTLALRQGSPAIDAGDPTEFQPFDQRGVARPQDGDGSGPPRSDIGAYERRLSDILPASPFDFDGDGRTDVSVFRPADGNWYLLRSSGGLSGVNFGLSSDKIAPADFDGDGKVDIAVYRPSTGVWYVINSSDSTVTYYKFGISEDLPTPADYDGDGKADISVFRPSSGTWYRTNSSDGSFSASQFGTDGDRPTLGDFDGDGKADIAVFRPSSGVWYQINSSDGSFYGEKFGIETDLTVPADHDGDGKTDLGIYRASEGLWYFKNSLTSTYTPSLFGLATDIPVVGDYDGDGKADIAVFRPSNGVWYVENSSNGGFTAVQWGQSGDQPVPSAFGN